jgi:hypothetical protein
VDIIVNEESVRIYKKFWEELVTNFPLIRHGQNRKEKELGQKNNYTIIIITIIIIISNDPFPNNNGRERGTQTYRQLGECINLLTKIRGTHTSTQKLIILTKISGQTEIWTDTNGYADRWTVTNRYTDRPQSDLISLLSFLSLISFSKKKGCLLDHFVVYIPFYVCLYASVRVQLSLYRDSILVNFG